MKRQGTETCWQTSSVPTAGIRFYLETDVMVIDMGSSHQPGIHAIDFAKIFFRVIKELWNPYSASVWSFRDHWQDCFLWWSRDLSKLIRFSGYRIHTAVSVSMGDPTAVYKLGKWGSRHESMDPLYMSGFTLMGGGFLTHPPLKIDPTHHIVCVFWVWVTSRLQAFKHVYRSSNIKHHFHSWKHTSSPCSSCLKIKLLTRLVCYVLVVHILIGRFIYCFTW